VREMLATLTGGGAIGGALAGLNLGDSEKADDEASVPAQGR